MPRFLLRVEGVNLASCIDDTDDLSTRRGGGLMLLNAVPQFEQMMAGQFALFTRVATGASIGVYVCEAGSADQVEQAARQHFRHGSLEYADRDESRTEHLLLRHATFVADAVPLDGTTEAAAADLAQAKNRWRQMQEPSLSLNGVWDAGRWEPCYLNCVRPASPDVYVTKDEAKRPASASVAQRRAYGRHARQSFYRTEAPDAAADLDFTNEFRELADRRTVGGGRGAAVPDNTHDKLAVVYLDGNKFGKLSHQAWQRGADGHREWSDALRRHHQQLLGQLLRRAAGDPAWRVGDSGAVRLETLLWGGDEILWVVPAWKGWEVAAWFFGQDHTVGKESLRYSCGLVFCHANAPIRNVTALAHKLGDAAKPVRGEANTHRLAYEVLESFDDIHGDLDAHRGKWLPKGTSPTDLLFDPGVLKDAWPKVQAVAASRDFPTRQLYRYCREWRTPTAGAKAEMAKSLKRMTATEAGRDFENFRQERGLSDVWWLHLLQMHPYAETPEATA